MTAPGGRGRDNITVSIVTPCYNGSAYLGDTLASALQQTAPPLEVIVVDDGSTDDSAAIAESFGSPVRVIRQRNQGESVARNRAIAEARGTHLLFLDADDLIAPESLARLSAALEGRPRSVGIMGCAWFTTDPDVRTNVQEITPRSFFPGILDGNFGPPHCWLAPRAIVQAVGGFCDTMRWFEDWDLWWRVGLEADGIVPLAEPYIGALYRQHAKSQLATTRPADRALGHATLVGRMVGAILERPDILEAHGVPLYWSAWSAVRHARDKGVAWAELSPLRYGLQALCRSGPPCVTALSSARLTRWAGVPVATSITRHMTGQV